MLPNNSMWQFVPDFHSINTNNYLFLCNNTKHMIQIQHYFMIEYAHISGILKIIPTVFQCGSERGSDSAFEERLMDAEIASGPNIALFWMLGLGQVLSPILFTLLVFTSIWYHQESVIVSFLIKPSFLPPQGLIPSRFTLEPSAAQTEADLKKASVKETQGNSTGYPEIKSPGILVTNSNPTNRFSMKYQISCIPLQSCN